MPTHKQQYMFFSVKDVNNEAMDDWMKLVQIAQWQRHDTDNCTVFHFVSLLRNPDPISKIFDDACITTLIDIARIGILAQLNEMLSMFGLLRYRKYAPQPNIEWAKKQTIGRIVHMVAQTIGKPNQSLWKIKRDETNSVETVKNFIDHQLSSINSLLNEVDKTRKIQQLTKGMKAQ